MQQITFSHFQKEKKKTPKYRWQEICLDIIKDLDVPKTHHWAVWRLWSQGGYSLLDKVQADIKDGAVKNPISYLLWKLKTFK